MRMYKRGEIYLASLGEGTGSEQKGERPVLIVQNDKGNKYSPTVTVVPITTKIHKSYSMPTHVRLGKNCGLERESAAVTEQITTIDKSKLGQYVGCVANRVMITAVNRAMRIQLGMISTKKGRTRDHAGA